MQLTNLIYIPYLIIWMIGRMKLIPNDHEVISWLLKCCRKNVAKRTFWYQNIFSFNKNKIPFNLIYLYHAYHTYIYIYMYIYNQNKFVFKMNFFWKYCFIKWIFHSIVTYLIFHFYLQKSEFYFQYIAARFCKKAVLRKIIKAFEQSLSIICKGSI